MASSFPSVASSDVLQYLMAGYELHNHAGDHAMIIRRAPSGILELVVFKIKDGRPCVFFGTCNDEEALAYIATIAPTWSVSSYKEPRYI